MEVNLTEIFPCLQKEISLESLQIELEDLQTNQYFHDLVENIIEDYEINNQKQANKKNNNLFQMKNIKEIQDIKSTVAKIYKKITAIKVPKGTVIYTIGMTPDYGYFIVHGCIELLRKKNSWEKLQQFEGHTIYRPQQRMQYLETNYHIDSRYFQHLESIFFEENVLFNSISFRKIYSKGYFGFRQIMGGSLRTKTAIALQQSILIRLKKQDFDKYLKQFQQKREQYIMANMMANISSDLVQQILPKLHNIFNSAEIVAFDKGENIIKEEEFTSALYFLISGEIVVSKDVNINVPKKYLSNENKGNFVKQMKVNLHKIVKNSFIGQIQPLLSKKQRQFTYQSNLNNTILIKFDANAFLKVISQSSSLERQMIIGAKYKYSTTMQNYINQKNTLVKSYFKQFQELDHKKKEKNVVNLLKNQNNFKQNQLYELFKRQGSFFRDSFERLQGFNDFQSKYNPSKSSINRHKIKSTLELTQAESKGLKKEANYVSISPGNDEDVSFEATKRVLMSPTKSSNPFQLINNEYKSKLQPVSEQSELNITKSSGTLRKKKRLFSKFQQLKKDETIFKRVMIKTGQVEAKKETDKSNRIEAIVNHKFDEVVKQCLTRKNVGLRKALLDKRQDIIRDQFTRTVATLPCRSMSTSHFQQVGSKTLTFKGAEQFRKKIDGFKNMRGSAFSSSEKPRDPPKLQQCIGYNKKPLSSQIKQRRMFMSPSKNGPRSPERIVLLNHMMKPIIYSSSQF